MTGALYDEKGRRTRCGVPLLRWSRTVGYGRPDVRLSLALRRGSFLEAGSADRFEVGVRVVVDRVTQQALERANPARLPLAELDAQRRGDRWQLPVFEELVGGVVLAVADLHEVEVVGVVGGEEQVMPSRKHRAKSGGYKIGDSFGQIGDAAHRLDEAVGQRSGGRRLVGRCTGGWLVRGA